jgi:flagella basal body P-ring formation protein FlgA
MLEDRRLVRGAGSGIETFANRSQILGKVARRTLLPGQAIPLNAVRDPDVVRSGKTVSIVFAVGELVITGRGLALQAGVVGDVISIQNSDSSVIVRGTVQADGTVRLED